ncbi:radical SAM family heme chaperone HemW [Xanthomarina sp. F2636L]|uniref:radical SAM family heme chaperone HemW n=1 Tax=Xanthomarina sp. F2636L TaxID=2996018 RepID=UPI00225E2069|nr:radical SAM family heme chaperone HemW [Xanthomarina sp. F2636L]MCX7550951.1 radical SAM family heme chaperone HemW [Xanthomarina sp. F2636L]
MENNTSYIRLSKNSSLSRKIEGAGVYIHIPFCKQACFYCDFHFSTSHKKKEELVQALAKELFLRKDEFNNQIIETIYFGGGTPSLLSLDELQFLIAEVYKNYKVTEDPEITLEANPDDLNKKQIIELSKSPVNRLSIGIQSFFEDDLKSMNRAHSSEEAKNCLSLATQYFDNITIDLIYGIPNMSLEKWNKNLQMTFDFGVNHISSYALTVEPKTALASFIKKGEYPPMDDELAQLHFNHLITKTKAQGFVHYEVSNFGKPNYFSKHNTSYWQGKPYLGIGPSAHSFNEHTRSWNVSNNTRYIKSIEENSLPSTKEILTIQEQYNEYVMTGLRTIWGVSLEKVAKDFGEDYKSYLLKTSEKFIEKDLLVITEDLDAKQNSIQKLKTTEKGWFLVDGIAAELFMI